MRTSLHGKRTTRARLTLNEPRHIPARDIFESDLVMCLSRIAKHYRRLANVLQHEVASIQLLRHSFGYFDGYRRMRNSVADQGHANFLRMDCRASLTGQA